MLSALDDAHTWFLYGVVYQEELLVLVVEGFVGDQTEDVRIGDHVIENLRPLEIRESSRRFQVRFSQFIAWQVVDESYTMFDKYEKREDKGNIQTLSRSKYLDYVLQNHGWFETVLGPANHYRVWTEDEVIDVVACEPPVIEPVVEPWADP